MRDPGARPPDQLELGLTPGDTLITEFSQNIRQIEAAIDRAPAAERPVIERKLTDVLASGAEKSDVKAATGTADARRAAHNADAAPAAKAPAKAKAAAKPKAAKAAATEE